MVESWEASVETAEVASSAAVAAAAEDLADLVAAAGRVVVGRGPGQADRVAARAAVWAAEERVAERGAA